MQNIEKKLMYIQSGYTLLEAIIVITIFAIIVSFATVNLLGSQQNVTLSSTLETIITDIKSQQIRVMTGDTQGVSNHSYYGIHFGTNFYTLFRGNTYNVNDTTNIVIPIDTAYQFTGVTLTGSNLIFIPLNGEIYGYSSIANALTLKDTRTLKTNTLKVNYLGVISTIN